MAGEGRRKAEVALRISGSWLVGKGLEGQLEQIENEVVGRHNKSPFRGEGAVWFVDLMLSVRNGSRCGWPARQCCA